MVRIGPEETDPDESKVMAETSEEAQNGWTQMLEDMRAMATDRAESGYETLTIPAGDTTPKAPDSGDDDEWGLTYLVPANKVEPFEDLYERADFEGTGVYQAQIGPHQFVVTECLDYESKIAVFIAGSYQLRHAGPLVRKAMDEEKMYTYVKQLDGTNLGVIEHDDQDAFFPNPETVFSYEPELPGGTETDFS